MRLNPVRGWRAHCTHAGSKPLCTFRRRAISSSSDLSAHYIPSRPDRGPDGGKPVAKLQRRSEGETMSIGSTELSHPSLSHADGLAASTADTFLLVGRVLLGWLFLASSAGIGGKLWNHAGFLGYLKNLGAPAPEVSSWIGAVVEFLIGAVPRARGGHPICRAALRVIPHRCNRAGPSLLGIPGRADGKPVQSLPQECCRPRRRAHPVRGRARPLQRRSDAVEERLSGDTAQLSRGAAFAHRHGEGGGRKSIEGSQQWLKQYRVTTFPRSVAFTARWRGMPNRSCA